jgi:hypothetical protein
MGIQSACLHASRLQGLRRLRRRRPSNVSPLVHGAEMRVAETQAVKRALRKAYGIGICSVEKTQLAVTSFEVLKINGVSFS